MASRAFSQTHMRSKENNSTMRIDEHRQRLLAPIRDEASSIQKESNSFKNDEMTEDYIDSRQQSRYQ